MSFNLSRLRRSDRIVGVSAIALLIFMFFFKWYGGSATSSVGNLSFSSSLNGWHTFTNSRWIWLLTIIVALVAVARAGGALEINPVVSLNAIVAALGALSTLLILYRIVHHPSGSGGSIAGVSYSYGIKLGIWLGLIAACGITYGAYSGMQAEGTSLSDVRDQASAIVSSAKGTPTNEPAPAEAPAPPAPAPAPPPEQ
jgi:hypothetical protein